MEFTIMPTMTKRAKKNRLRKSHGQIADPKMRKTR